MPLDARIPLGVQPVQIQSPFEAMGQLAQLQEARDAAETRRLAAEETRTKRNRTALYEQAMKRAVTIGPDGQPTVDYAALLPDLPADVLFEVKKTVDENVERMTRLRTANLTLEEKMADYLGGVARSVRAAQYHPDAYGLAITNARKAGAFTQEHADRLLNEAAYDPTAIQRHVDSAIAQVSGDKPAMMNVGPGGVVFDPVTQQPVFTNTPQQTGGFTLGAGQTRYGPSGEVIAAGPPPAPAAGGFTLGPGGVRYGPSGEVIASRPAAPSASGEPLVAVVGPDGQPVLVPRSQAAGARPARGAAADAPGGVKLSPALQDDIATMLTVQDLGKSALTLGDQIKWRGTGPVAGRIGAVGAQFGAGGEDPERLRNLIGNIQGTIAKLRGGTAFSAQEQRMLESYTPTPTDSVLQIKAKLKSLDEFITAKRENLLRVAGGQFTPRETTTPPPPPGAGGRGGGGGLTYEDYLRSRGGR